MNNWLGFGIPCALKAFGAYRSKVVVFFVVLVFANRTFYLDIRFRGAGRAAFDQFKGRADEISVELSQALGAVLQGISGMDAAFMQGESAMVDETQSIEGSSAFDAARFGAR